MLKLTLRNKSLNIDFQHNLPIKTLNGEIIEPYNTKCIIEFGNDRNVKTAKVGKSDNACKSTGRRISIKRTLAEFDFTKAERTFIYSEYFKKAKK